MNLRTHLVALGVAATLLIGGASEAQAAKGVKKKKGTEHHHHGKVVAVDHKAGTFSIREHHKGKKKKAVAAGKSANHVHKFSVTSSTKFSTSHKKNRKPSSFTALHVGEHVSVAAKNHHADAVVIHDKAKKKVKKAGKKPVKKAQK